MFARIACVAVVLVLCGCRSNDPAPADGGAPAASASATEQAPAATPATQATPAPPDRAAVLRALSQPVPVLPMKVEEMRSLGDVKTYTLEPSYFPVALPDQTQIRVPAILERTPYHVRASVEFNGLVQEWVGDAWCFDLHSADPAHPYSHTFWMNTHKEPLGEGLNETISGTMQFFAHPNGEKYLASTTYHEWLLDVSRVSAVEDTLPGYISRKLQVPSGEGTVVNALLIAGEVIYEGSAPVRHIPVWHLFPGDAFSTASGPIHLEIKDISKDEQGNLVVSVVGLDPKKVLKAIFDGKEWHAGTDEASATSTP